MQHLDHSPTGRVLESFALARGDMHSPRASVKYTPCICEGEPCHLTHVKDDVMLTNAKRDTRYRKKEVHRDEIAIQNEDNDSDDSERVTETENQEEGRHGNVNDGSEEEDDQEMCHQDNESNESE